MRRRSAGAARAARLAALAALALAAHPARALNVGVIGKQQDSSARESFMAMLAANHFNARAAHVVPQFGELGGCALRINATLADYLGLCGPAVDRYIDGRERFGWEALWGPGRSACAEALAILGRTFGTVHVSATSTSPTLDDEALYPFFARVVPSDDAIAGAMVAYAAHHGWSRVGVLYEQDGSFADALAAAIRSEGLAAGIAVESAFYPDAAGIAPAVASLTAGSDGRGPYRVVFAICTSADLPTVVEAAVAEGMLGVPGRHWVFSDAVRFDNFLAEPWAAHLDGSAQILAAGAAPDDPTWVRLQAEWRNLTSDAFGGQLPPGMGLAEAGLPPLPSDAAAATNATWTFATPLSGREGLAYDAMAAIGLGGCALEAAIAAGEVGAEALESATGRAHELHARVKALAFTGVSGSVRFDAVGTRTPTSARSAVQNIVAAPLGSGLVLRALPFVGVYADDAWVFERGVRFFGGSSTPPLDGTALTSCPAGQYYAGEGVCNNCPSGTVSQSGSTSCEQCERGTAASRSRKACVPCESDAYQDEAGSDECERCPLDSAHLVPSGTRARPFNSARGATNASACACVPGTFLPSAFDSLAEAGAACAACPTGGVCDGTGEDVRIRPQPLPGWYGRPSAPEVFVACAVQAACPGGGLGVCSAAYTGDVCSDCAAGWYAAASHECVPCSGSHVAVAVLALVILLLAAAAVHLAANLREKDELRAGAKLSSTVAAAADFQSLLLFLQVVSMLDGASVRWPESVSALMRGLSWVNLDVSVFSAECTWGLGFVQRWRLQAAAPFYVLAVYLGYTLLVPLPRALLGPEPSDARSRVHACKLAAYRSANACVLALHIVYIFTARAGLAAFTCRQQPDGTRTMAHYPAMVCGSEEWAREVMPVGVASVVLVVVYPLALAAVFARGYDQKSEAIRISTAIARVPYKRRFYFWEAVELLRKLAVAAALAAVGLPGVAQLAFVSAATAIALALTLRARPFRHALVNDLSAAIHSCLLLVLLCGMVFSVTHGAASAARQGGGAVLAEGGMGASAQTLERLTIALTVIIFAAVSVACGLSLAHLLFAASQYYFERRVRVQHSPEPRRGRVMPGGSSFRVSSFREMSTYLGGSGSLRNALACISTASSVAPQPQGHAPQPQGHAPQPQGLQPQDASEDGRSGRSTEPTASERRSTDLTSNAGSVPYRSPAPGMRRRSSADGGRRGSIGGADLDAQPRWLTALANLRSRSRGFTPELVEALQLLLTKLPAERVVDEVVQQLDDEDELRQLTDSMMLLFVLLTQTRMFRRSSDGSRLAQLMGQSGLTAHDVQYAMTRFRPSQRRNIIGTLSEHVVTSSRNLPIPGRDESCARPSNASVSHDFRAPRQPPGAVGADGATHIEPAGPASPEARADTRAGVSPSSVAAAVEMLAPVTAASGAVALNATDGSRLVRLSEDEVLDTAATDAARERQEEQGQLGGPGPPL